MCRYFWTTSDYKHAGGRNRIYNHPNALHKQLGWREARTLFPMEESTARRSARNPKHREHEAAACKVNASEQCYERGRDLTLRIQLAKPKRVLLHLGCSWREAPGVWKHISKETDMELLSMNFRENPNKSELLRLPRRKLKGNVRTNCNT